MDIQLQFEMTIFPVMSHVVLFYMANFCDGLNQGFTHLTNQETVNNKSLNTSILHIHVDGPKHHKKKTQV